MKQRHSADAGFSLIEILIAMVILGIGSVSIMAAIGTSVFSASAHRSYATAETVTRDFAEAINLKANSAVPYVLCPTATDLMPTAAQFTGPTNGSGQALYLFSIEAPPAPWNAESSAAVQYWIPSTFPNGTFQGYRDCWNMTTPLGWVQQQCKVADPLDGGYGTGANYKPVASCDPGLQRVWIHVKTNPVVANSCAKLVDCVDQYSRILVRRNDEKASS